MNSVSDHISETENNNKNVRKHTQATHNSFVLFLYVHCANKHTLPREPNCPFCLTVALAVSVRATCNYNMCVCRYTIHYE